VKVTSRVDQVTDFIIDSNRNAVWTALLKAFRPDILHAIIATECNSMQVDAIEVGPDDNDCPDHASIVSIGN